jgi:septal ring factor EnvC (AmiA/AmiB activator)
MESLILVSSIVGFLALVFGGVFYFLFTLRKRIRSLSSGKNGNSLESTITQALENIKALQEENKSLRNHIASLDKRLLKTLQQPPIKRFNAFADSGGNQSFATAFITEEGNGVALSTIYSREKTSVFAKQISHYTATQELTSEEQEVLDTAKKAYEKK